MATLNQISTDLLLIVRGGKLSSSENISQRQVEFWAHNTRAQILSNEIAKRRTIPDNIVQSLGCLNVSLVDASACCGISVSCDVLRTDVTIPNAIVTPQKTLITRIGPADLTARAYTIIPYKRAAYAGSGKFTKSQTFAFVHGDYVYLMGPNVAKFKRINVQGVWEDPTQAATFNTCAGDACYTSDSEYPISTRHIEVLKRMILDNNFKIITSAPTDTTGDSKSNPELEQK